MKHKLAILASHPIQYQAPFFKFLADQSEIDLVVYFKKSTGVKKGYFDVEFGREVKWDIPLLDGYRYCFLKGSIDFWVKLRRDKYDAIFIYGWNSLLSWLTVVFAKLIGIKVLLQGENPLNQEFMKPKWKRLVKKFIFGKILFGLINAFLYIGEENRKFYKHYGIPESKLFFTPYAVDNARFVKEYQVLSGKHPRSRAGSLRGRQVLRDELKISKDDVVILFVGKLIPKKRPLDLLKAYEILNTKYQIPNTIHLVFVGDGGLRGKLEQYTKKNNLDNVHFLGFKNQTELPKYYSTSDIFVLPSSIGETWGLVINEAMNFGLPVIISNVVGCGSDLVKHDKNGFVFLVGNVAVLAEHLRALVMNTSRRETLGQKSLEIIQRYNYDEDAKGVLEALNHVRHN